MLNRKHIEEFSNRLSELLAATPARDLEKNFRALLSGLFAHFDLISREEYEVQREVLLRTREKLEALEARVAKLEAPPDKHAKG